MSRGLQTALGMPTPTYVVLHAYLRPLQRSRLVPCFLPPAERLLLARLTPRLPHSYYP
jgi:hypothetical protein